MKTLFTTVALTAGLLVAAAGSANALTQADCEARARAATDAAYPLGKGVVTGGVIGALGGLAVGAATGGNAGKAAGTGALIGGGVGTVAYQTKRQNYYQSILADCLRGVTTVSAPPPPPQPGAVFPPPTPQATQYSVSALNVRVCPQVSGACPPIGALANGVGASVESCTTPASSPSGWCYIGIVQGWGWASKSYLSFY